MSVFPGFNDMDRRDARKGLVSGRDDHQKTLHNRLED
jgi:hypothetical protein